MAFHVGVKLKIRKIHDNLFVNILKSSVKMDGHIMFVWECANESGCASKEGCTEAIVMQHTTFPRWVFISFG